MIAAITCTGISACGKSDPPTTTVTGEFALTASWAYLEPDGTPIRPGELASDAQPAPWNCIGIGGFADITTGAVVTMLDSSGKTVASGKITGTETTPWDRVNKCILHWDIEHAPKGMSGAQVRIGQHPASALDSDYETHWPSITLVQ